MSAALSLFFLSASAAFADCDHPGTANPVVVTPVSPTSLRIAITNTAKEGSNTDIWFEVEDKDGHAHRKNYGHIPYGRVVYDVWDNLAPGQTSCYHVWTRDDNLQGCRSETPGAWVCGTTPTVGPPNSGPTQLGGSWSTGPMGGTPGPPNHGRPQMVPK